MNQPTKSVSLPLIVLTIVFMSHFRLNAQDRINQEKAGSLHYEQGMEALRSGENLKATVKYFEKAAAEGNANAQYIVGRYLLNANHSPSTEKEAYDLLLESAKKGQMDALSEVSKHFDSFSIDSRNSINSKLKELSGNGDLKASSLLAQAYLNGTMGYSKDPQKALSLLEKTVVLQDSQDEYLLGALYLTGQGGKRDYLKAEALFSKGLKKAYAPSIFSLGYQHFRGLGVVQDYKKAKAYFQKSATLGYADAHALLASLYYYGLGVTEDLESALMELEKGVEKGSDQARSILEEINKKEPRSFSELDRVNLSTFIPNEMYPFSYNELSSMNASMNDFEGLWEGRMITYDWSGQKVMDEADVNFNISRQDPNQFNADLAILRGDLNQYPNQKLSFSLTQNEGGYNVENATFKKYSFVGLAVEKDIQHAKFVLNENDGVTYLRGNLKIVDVKNGEMGRPTSIILQRKIEQIPSLFTLYPNPFEKYFDLQFTSSEEGKLKVTIHSLDGKTVEVFDDKQITEGINSIRISPDRKLSKGIYLLSLTTGQRVESQLIFKN